VLDVAHDRIDEIDEALFFGRSRGGTVRVRHGTRRAAIADDGEQVFEMLNLHLFLYLM
jgi:hypothetical protein